MLPPVASNVSVNEAADQFAVYSLLPIVPTGMVTSKAGVVWSALVQPIKVYPVLVGAESLISS